MLHVLAPPCMQGGNPWNQHLQKIMCCFTGPSGPSGSSIIQNIVVLLIKPLGCLLKPLLGTPNSIACTSSFIRCMQVPYSLLETSSNSNRLTAAHHGRLFHGPVQTLHVIIRYSQLPPALEPTL